MSIVLNDDELKEFEEDSEWLNDNYNTLLLDYNNEYVALRNKTIVKHDADLDKLKEKLNEVNIKLDKVLVEFIRDKKNQLHWLVYKMFQKC